MKKLFLLLLIPVFSGLPVFSQMYILNEDFSGTSGTTPPGGWSNDMISGTATDLWHFDNPGQRMVNYPVTEPFAVFDADSVSGNGSPESASLESPQFDASISNFILLNFQHAFVQGNGSSGRVEAYNGSDWLQVASFTNTSQNPSSEILDLSSVIGGITNARIRFVWSGNSQGWWAIDNIRIYASLPLDAGVVSLDNPINPVAPGIHNVAVTLGNFGYNTLSSVAFNWTVDGIAQAPFPWTGSLGFGQVLENVVIGSFNFQDPVRVKIWQSSPNGQPDPNPYNDTISVYVKTTLCGTYTIGGSNPDFDSFADAASVLNDAGVTCPITFLVRDGLYREQFILRNIPGSSASNTVTFRSESGDSTAAVLQISPGALKYEPMIRMEGAHHVIFEGLGFFTGSDVSYANNAILMEGVQDIEIRKCYFESHNQLDYGILAQAASRRIDIGHSRFKSISGRAGSVHMTGNGTREISFHDNRVEGAQDWGYVTIRSGFGTRQIAITDNYLERCYRAVYLEGTDSALVSGNHITNTNDGVFVDDLCSAVRISENHLTGIKSHPNEPEGTAGITVNEAGTTAIFNNFIQTTGTGPVTGIDIIKSTGCAIHFNSVNITNTDLQKAGKGFSITSSHDIIAYNNIFNVKYAGTPVYIAQPTPGLDLDRNDYYNHELNLGFYNGKYFTGLQEWITATGQDQESVSVIPFFTNDTDLSINQAVLNNAGIPVSGIPTDIDGTLRNPVSPDIGAREYTPCNVDAGINAVTAPQNPLVTGNLPVKVLLQNQGNQALNSVKINWKVNDATQTQYSWNGNLPAGANEEVQIGTYLFQPGEVYIIQARTSDPNGTTDCNVINDTIASSELATPLCGVYTIGGASPDYPTISQAINVLNLAGVSCPVEFVIRDGVYEEQFTLGAIAGSSLTNTITFRSESGDSSKAVIHIPLNAPKFTTMVTLNGTANLTFRELGLFTGSDQSFDNNAVILSGASNITIERCLIDLPRESDLGIGILDQSNGIIVRDNYIDCKNGRAMAVNVADNSTRNIQITGNFILGATDYNYTTVRIGSDTRSVNISANHLERCYQAVHLVGADSVDVTGNTIVNSNYGIFVDNFCSVIRVSANRLSYIKSLENVTEGTAGINLQNSVNIEVFNNFIHTTGNGPVHGIRSQNITFGKIHFNSVNIGNTDPQARCTGFLVAGNSNGFAALNNIFSLVNPGTPVNIINPGQEIDLDRNDYYSTDKTIGYYKGRRYTDLEVWADSVNNDENSVSVLPFFTTETNLSINQALLNNAGDPVPGITTDIDGTLRDPAKPDIGAREYDPCQSDAGINTLVSPANPLSSGTLPVIVQLQNQGTSALTSARINWQVNGQDQTVFNWSGNLAVAGNAEVQIGEYTFQSGRLYEILVWASDPNGNPDCNHANDTAYGRNLAAPLCGTYTIGGDAPDFNTVGDAVTVLNGAGIDCAVIFLIRDGIYYERLTLGDIRGSSSSNTITFRGESGDSSLVLLKILPGATQGESLLLLEGTRFVSFINLGLATGSANSIANVAVLLSGVEDIVIRNCAIQSLKESDFGVEVSDISQRIIIQDNRFDCPDNKSAAINIEGNGTSHIDITRNRIKGNPLRGSTLLRINSGTGKISVMDNHIENSYRAVFINAADSVEIQGNFIDNSHDGIYAGGGGHFLRISANRLTNIRSHQNSPEGTSGILVQNQTGVEVVNNFVHTLGNGPVLGINLQQVDTCRVIYNSVNVTNQDPQSKSKGLYLTDVSEVSSRNNILNVRTYGVPVHLGTDVTGFFSDYNDYYHPTGIVGRIGNTTYTSLFEWGTAVNGDANSGVVNPYFKGDTIPLPFQRALNGAGIPVPGITTDIDGKVRFAQAPDVGCVEFTVDYGILELLSPTLECYHDDTDSVTVLIKMFGDVPFSELKIAYRLDDGPVHLDTIPGPVYGDIIHTFNTIENISAEGEYLFKIWLINTLDDNINNDTLNAWRYTKPSPVVSMGYDNFCTGWTVNFTGSATVVSPYTIESFEWLFGDGETSTEQNPVHAFLQPGYYDVTLRAYSNAGCYGYITESVYIDPNFQGLSLAYNLVNEICFGDYSGSLELIPSGGYPPYKVYLNETQVDNYNIPSLTSGVYVARVEDSENCSVTDTIIAQSTVYLNPRIEASPLSGLTPLAVQFGFTANDPVNWTWYFPEGDVIYPDTSRSPAFTFVEYGTHEVILEVMSGHPDYCTERDTVEIFVDVIVTIDYNTVFTPNEDGYNDFFEIRTTAVRELKANIYNQWGNKVYEINDLVGKWDGKTTGGAEAPDGTYFFTIIARGFDNKDHERSGAVLLLRNAARAFPNPVTDHLKVEVYGPLDPSANFIAYSVFGQVALSGSVNGSPGIDIDLSNLSKGIYMLKIFDENRHYFVRIIKN